MVIGDNYLGVWLILSLISGDFFKKMLGGGVIMQIEQSVSTVEYMGIRTDFVH